MAKVTVTIDGMMCGMCEAHIKDAIRKRYPEAKKVSADHTRGTASFNLVNDMPVHMMEHELKSDFKQLGYDMTDIQVSDIKESKGFLGLFK